MTRPSTAPSISAITLGVRSVAASTSFYAEGLGFAVINRVGDEIAFVQAGHGLMLALWNVEQMPSEYGAVGHGELAPPLSLGHNVTAAGDVDRWFARAVAAGAEVITEPTRQPWGGTSACVADPDGFRWDFVHNPAFGVTADGAVTGV
ncbi:VOC family protein [Gordonia zhaorongruii]|uniref:VOC family protein n=1 Tax=Gordonia zhaorongruii TaxID=2597659 RepID=UPI001042BAA2|nr:VOC family protein [Gordonia zhaorongruii]